MSDPKKPDHPFEVPWDQQQGFRPHGEDAKVPCVKCGRTWADHHPEPDPKKLIEEARTRAENEAAQFWARCEGYGQNEGACIHQPEGGVCVGCARRWAIEQLRDLILSFSMGDALEAAQKEIEQQTQRAERAEHNARCYANELPDPDTPPEETHLGRAEAQVASLREALRKYGSHLPGCNYYGVERLEWSCDCGLERALGASQEGEGKDGQ